MAKKEKVQLVTIQSPIVVPSDEADGIGDSEIFQARRILGELAARNCEALNLYQPLLMQDAFHKSRARDRTLRGSNRSGKTLGGAVEVARAVLNKDPYKKYPAKGIFYCVGYDGRHIAEVMWKKLAMPGAFRIIRDMTTNQWRTFQPNDPVDSVRISESRPVGPLIPERMIKSIAWEEKKTRQPKKVTLVNDWELHFLSGHSHPPKGTDIDGCWFDEELDGSHWYPEMSGRLVDRNGLFFWSATPQAGTEQLYELHERSEKERELGVKNRLCEEFVLLIDDNLHMTPQQRYEFLTKLNEDDRAVRIGGEFVFAKSRVFPEYSPLVHNVEVREIPPDWTRYAAIDPGRQICAVLFAAVPPAGIDGIASDTVWLYDELYIPNCDAIMFGRNMKMKTEGQTLWAFIIDGHEARKNDTGYGRTIECQYSEQLEANRVVSQTTGSGFAWGSDNPKAGIEAIRPLLRTDQWGAARLRIMGEKVPNFVWELRHYRFKKKLGVITDDPESVRRVHQMANLRYLAQYGLEWHPPLIGGEKKQSAYGAFQRIQKRRAEASGAYESFMI